MRCRTRRRAAVGAGVELIRSTVEMMMEKSNLSRYLDVMIK
jgi:hypothetical protein